MSDSPEQKKNPNVVRISARHEIEFRELDGFSSSGAEAIAAHFVDDGDSKTQALQFGAAVSKAYALCSVAKINGKAVVPDPLQGRLAYRALAEQFTLRETAALLNAWSKLFGDETGEALKNE